jgi:hypothetical protein
MRGHKLLSIGALFLALTAAACGYYRITPKAIEPGQLTVQSPTEISTPAKAHLKDGGVVLFSEVSVSMVASSRGKERSMISPGSPASSCPSSR